MRVAPERERESEKEEKPRDRRKSTRRKSHSILFYLPLLAERLILLRLSEAKHEEEGYTFGTHEHLRAALKTEERKIEIKK